jgi:hypothetical protein
VTRSFQLAAACLGLCAVTAAASLSISTKSLSDAMVGEAYSATLTASGGNKPYTWSVLTGSLPPGLSLSSSTGAITGTPTAAGNFSFTVRAIDNSADVDVQALGIRVLASPIIITTASLPVGQVGVAYSQTLQATGGVPPYGWTISSGSLPAGFRLSGAQITGTPTAAGSSAFTVRATDSTGASMTRDLSIAIVPQLSITNCPAGSAIVGQAYSATLAATGGTPPYSWRIASGALPLGLVLDSARALVLGTPTQAGSVAFLLRLDDSSGNNASLTCSILVNPASSAPPLAITSAAALPGGTAGAAYSQTLTATGGRPPYAWSLTGANVPTGLSIQSASGVLSGTPTAAGAYAFVIQVRDQDGTSAQQNVTLTIAAAASTGPSMTISGLSDVVDPAQQINFSAQLDAPYPSALTGTLTLSFTPDPAVGMDDPTILFSNGSRTLTFSVPASSRTPTFSVPVPSLQTGTVAGTIQITVAMQSSGNAVTSPSQGPRVMRVIAQPPKIVTIRASTTSSGFSVSMIGFTTTRDVSQAVFHFATPSGTTIDVPVSLSTASRTWFQSGASAPFGGQFGLVQVFTWQGTPVSGVNSVTATLSNAQGTSGVASTQF